MKRWQLRVVRWVSCFCIFLIAIHGYDDSPWKWMLFLLSVVVYGLGNNMEGDYDARHREQARGSDRVR